jgi:hypothetical protein
VEHTEVELLCFREMGHAGHECLPERPIIGPLRKGSVDGRVVHGWLAVTIWRHGHAPPLHPCVEHPHDEIKETMIAQFAPGATLGHGEVWQDTCIELSLDNWTGSGVVEGFCASILIRHWPHRTAVEIAHHVRQRTAREAEESTAVLRWTAVDQSEVRTHIGLGDEVGVATYGTSGKPGLPGDIRMAVTGRLPAPGKEATTAPAGSRMVTITLEPSSMKVCPSLLTTG